MPRPDNDTVHEVLIEDYDERYAPPEQDMLRVSLVGDGDDALVFLEIGPYVERNDGVVTERRFLVKAGVGVKLGRLRRTLDYIDG